MVLRHLLPKSDCEDFSQGLVKTVADLTSGQRKADDLSNYKKDRLTRLMPRSDTSLIVRTCDTGLLKNVYSSFNL